MNSFSFTASDIAYLRTVLPHCEEAFFVWLKQLDCRNVRLYALEEGSLCFPRVPLIRVEVRQACGGDALRCCVRVGVQVMPFGTAFWWRSPSRLTLLLLLVCRSRLFFVLVGAAWCEGTLCSLAVVPVAILIPRLLLGVPTGHGLSE